MTIINTWLQKAVVHGLGIGISIIDADPHLVVSRDSVSVVTVGV